MNRIRSLFAMILSILILTSYGLIAVSSEAKYPDRPITWVVPFGPGGASDRFARIITEAAREVEPNVRFIIINVPGAQTLAGYTYAMNQPSDGYTLYGATTDIVLNIANGRGNYTLDDITPVVRVQQDVDMWFIRLNDSRYKTIGELLDYCRTHPGKKLKIATTGIDGSDAYAIKAFERCFDIKLTIVPYDSPGERYAALMGGTVDILYEQPGDLKAFIESNLYVPVVVMSKNRLNDFPDIPTSVELGVNVITGYWRGVIVKDGVSEDTVSFIADLLEKAMNTDTYQRYEKDAYLNLRNGYLAPDEFGIFLDEELTYYDQAANN